MHSKKKNRLQNNQEIGISHIGQGWYVPRWDTGTTSFLDSLGSWPAQAGTVPMSCPAPSEVLLIGLFNFTSIPCPFRKLRYFHVMSFQHMQYGKQALTQFHKHTCFFFPPQVTPRSLATSSGSTWPMRSWWAARSARSWGWSPCRETNWKSAPWVTASVMCLDVRVGEQRMSVLMWVLWEPLLNARTAPSAAFSGL